MSFSLDEQRQQFSGGLPFDVNRSKPPKYVYAMLPLQSTTPVTNLEFYTMSSNDELDLQVDNNMTGRWWTGFVDTNQFTSVRLVTKVILRGPDNSLIRLKYATADVDGSYLPMLTGGVNLDVATDATGWVDTGWQKLAAGAIAEVIYLRLFVVNGADDGVHYASVVPLEAWFR